MENFIALDFETATAWRGSICEIGLAFVEEGKVVDKKSWLVKPPKNAYDEYNTYIHGIDASMTKNAPTITEIWPSIKSIIDGHILVAHNTSFDMYVLKCALDKYKLEYPSIEFACSYRLAQMVLTTYRYSLDSLCEGLGIDMGSHHRAGDDAKACAEVMLKLLQLSNKESIHELVAHYGFNIGTFGADSFSPFVLKNKAHHKLDLSQIVGDPDKLNPESYFYGKNICFTGKFLYGSREELLQKIVDIGGVKSNSVTKKTEILVVGQQDFRVVGDSGMSSKQKKAISLLESGQQIEIMSEDDFYTWLDDAEVMQKVNQARDTVAMMKAMKETKQNTSSSSEIVFRLVLDHTTGKFNVEVSHE